MASPIDELIIRIKADTKQLQSELKKVEGKIKVTGAAGGAAFGMGAAGLGGKLKALAGPAAIGAVVIGLTKMATFAVRAGMEFEDLKDSLDTVFGSVEAGDKQFKRILDFAQNTPFQIDTVTKAFISLGSVGIEPTQRQMQVFADTASVAVDSKGAFEALIRVQQRAAAGALGLQELNMLADRGIDVFKGLKDELGLSRLELADFGQTAGGSKLIIETLTKVLEDQFGGAMISKMDNLSTSVSNMGIAFKTLGNEVSESGLGFAMKAIVNTSTNLINNLAIAIAQMRGAGLGISLEAPKMKRDMSFEQMQEERLKAATSNIKKIRAKIASLSDVGDGGMLETALNNLLDSPSLGIADAAFKKVIQMFTGAGLSAEEATNLIKNLRDELANQTTNQIAATRTQEDATKAEIDAFLVKGKLVSAYGKIEKHLQKAAGDTKILEFAQANLGQIFKDNKLELIALGIASEEELLPVLKAMKSGTEEVAETFTSALAPAIQSMSMAFTSDFVNSLLAGESALDSFKNFSKNIVSQIISTFLQMAVINRILNSIFGSSGFGVEGFDLPELKFGKAGGGAIQGGRATLVGERGPEIFVPNTGGTIMNNMNSKNAMGGGGTTIINQSINFATGVVPTVRAEVIKMLPQIADVTKGAVAEAAMRGGSYRRMLQGG
tara:strand:+ start:320 stop:2317 length:1998 start_codon:yes stop_codon:yes gene_type:complete